MQINLRLKDLITQGKLPLVWRIVRSAARRGAYQVRASRFLMRDSVRGDVRTSNSRLHTEPTRVIVATKASLDPVSHDRVLREKMHTRRAVVKDWHWIAWICNLPTQNTASHPTLMRN